MQFWKILTGGIILSFIITSGQITYWHFVVFLWLAIAMFPLVGQSYSDKKKIIGKSFCIVAAIVVIGIGLSGIYISSLLDVKQYTDLYVKLDANAALNRQAFNLHPLYLITLFIPDFFGNITGKNMANLIPDNLVNFWESNMSGGIAVSLIIFFCLVMIFFCPNLQKRQRWIALIMGGVYLFAILCVLGQYTPFYEHIISQIPIIRIFPYPVRYRMLQCFAVAILMPLGIDYLMRDNGLSQKKRYLKCGVLIYTIFMFSVIATVLAWSDKKVHQEWSNPLWRIRESAGGRNFDSAKFIGQYSPAHATERIGLIFDGQSTGEIRYSDDNTGLPTEGVLAANYYASGGGWHEFKVKIPPNKFVWICRKQGGGEIEYIESSGAPDLFYYDVYGKKWEKRMQVNSICFYHTIISKRPSLIANLKDNTAVKRSIVNSLIYCIAVLFIIIFAGYSFSPRRFAYLIGIVSLLEFIVFGFHAFYYSEYDFFEPGLQDMRTIMPVDNIMFQRMEGMCKNMAGELNLRIATENPYYDNFARVGMRPAFMGYEMQPLEKRFKRAIEKAYGIPVGWDLYQGQTMPKYIEFLDNFSVKYFLISSQDPVFREEECVSFANDKEVFAHINSNALPRVFTIGNIVVTSDEEQLEQLVRGDLRKAVYTSFLKDISSETRGIDIANPTVLSFDALQEANPIKRFSNYNPNGVDIDIFVTIPSMLVVTDVWYPGWEVNIDNRRGYLYRVNYCQKGVWLEKGRHFVRFRFCPLAWKIGVAVTLLTILSILIVVCIKSKVYGMQYGKTNK